MNIFPKPVRVGDQVGFSEDLDIFQRKAMAEPLTNLLTNVTNPVVIALDGEWGSGKTTFLKMWAGDLRNRGFPTIYIDAFENDFEADPFTTLASHLIEIAPNNDSISNRENLIKKASSVAKFLGRSSLKIGVKVLTLGALQAADFDEFGSIIAGDIGEDFDNYIDLLLSESAKKRTVISQFKNAIENLSPSINGNLTDVKPLVIIIDELDRCRPDYALLFLERIKHFFNVDMVHFVIGAHVSQLENSVRAEYGAEIDAHLYLQKFINLRFSIVENAKRQHEMAVNKYISYLLKVVNIPCDSASYRGEVIEIIREYAVRQSLSLRSTERFISYVALAVAGTKNSSFRPDGVMVGLCLLRVIAPDLFLDAKRGIVEFDKIDAALKIPDDDSGKYERMWWLFLSGDNEVKGREPFQSLAFDYNIRSGADAVYYVANYIVDNFEAAIE